jgi:hypothetical protein
MGEAMRWNTLFLLPVLAAAAEIGGSSVRTVYILPMSNGLDQYIANQLTREHLLEVIADPVRADAIFTDRLGELLEYKLEKLHPKPKPEVVKENGSTSDKADSDKAELGKDEADKADSDKAEADQDESGKNASEKTDSAVKAKPRAPKTYEDTGPPRVSTIGRAKGTLFLVDAHSRLVLWSIYEKPTISNPHNLDLTAKHVVNRLKQDLAGK